MNDDYIDLTPLGIREESERINSWWMWVLAAMISAAIGVMLATGFDEPDEVYQTEIGVINHVDTSGFKEGDVICLGEDRR